MAFSTENRWFKHLWTVRRPIHSWTLDPAVFKDAFYFVLVPPSPRGIRGRVRIVISLRKSMIWARFRPGSGGYFIFNFYVDLKYSWGALQWCPVLRTTSSPLLDQCLQVSRFVFWFPN